MAATNLATFGAESYSQTNEFKQKLRDSFREASIAKMTRITKNNLIDFNSTKTPSSWVCSECGEIFQHTFGFMGFKNVPLCPVCYPPNLRGKEERVLVEWLRSEFPSEPLICNSCSIIPPKELDIYFPDRKLAIEFDEIAWHCENDFNGVAAKNKYYHLNKTTACRALGVTLLHIWNVEWRERKEIIQSLIRSHLGASIPVYARKCTCRELSTKIAKPFFEENHVQGFSGGKFKYGLFLDDELLSSLIITPQKFNPKSLEITRFVTKKNFRVIGGFSKLWAYFLKGRVPFDSIKSYSDLRYFSGAVNSQAGFILQNVNPPTYYYTRDYKSLYHRMNFSKRQIQQKGLLYMSDLTEWENMQLNGYNRIWDCGQNVWVLKSE